MTTEPQLTAAEAVTPDLAAAERAARDLFAIADPLIGLLDQETALLRKMAPHATHDLHEEKQRMIRAYEDRARTLKAQEPVLAELDTEIRAKLRTTATRFEEAVKANVFAIKAAQEANERVMHAIVEAVKERRNRSDSYGANAQPASDGCGAKDGVALAFDQRL